MKSHPKFEVKFLVPQAARAGLATEMSRGSASLDRTSLAALYLDTEDRRLARAGIAWRLRREGRRWIQTLKSARANTPERFEHEVIRPGPSHDAAAHGGTPLGERLITVLRRAEADGVEVGVRFQTEIRRTTRRIRTRGAVVEVALDEGRLVAEDATQRIRELEFELISGSPAAMLTLAERWRKRFGLIYDPRSKAERGDLLAGGSLFPPPRKASIPRHDEDATAAEAFGAVLDECLAQITHNAVGLIEGDPANRVEHVHQLRVGIRRLRSALRSYAGWAPSPPSHLVEALRSLFATLGMSRDSDVLGSGVIAQLAKVGAPAMTLPTKAAGPDPVDAVKANATQQAFLGWIAWRVALAHESGPEVAQVGATHSAGTSETADATSSEDQAGVERGAGIGVGDEQPIVIDAAAYQRHVERRLRRWHRRLVADWDRFDELDDAALHALRKRTKRQRYAVEFFCPVLGRRKTKRYLGALAVIQARLGELNDLFVARAYYQALASDAGAWFALGWLAARIAEARALAKPALAELAKVDPPTH